MKRFLLFATLLALLVSPFAHAEWTDFNDVDSDDSYYVSISALKREGVVEGYASGEFGPNNAINRAELAKVVTGVFGMELAPQDSECFPDVPANKWYTPYVCAAQREGIFQGDGNGNFNLTQSTNRAEFAAVVSRLMARYEVSDEANTSDGPWFRGYFAQEMALNISARAIEEADEDEQAGRAVSRKEVIESFFRVLALQHRAERGTSYIQSIRDAYLDSLGYSDLTDEEYLDEDEDAPCDNPDTEAIELCGGSTAQNPTPTDEDFNPGGNYCGTFTVRITEDRTETGERSSTTTESISLENYNVEFYVEEEGSRRDITVTELSGSADFSYSAVSDGPLGHIEIISTASGSYSPSSDNLGGGAYSELGGTAYINFNVEGFSVDGTQLYTDENGSTTATYTETWSGGAISNSYTGQEFPASQAFTRGSVSWPDPLGGSGETSYSWNFSEC